MISREERQRLEDARIALAVKAQTAAEEFNEARGLKVHKLGFTPAPTRGYNRRQRRDGTAAAAQRRLEEKQAQVHGE